MTLALGTSAADLRVGSSAISKMLRGSTAFWDADAADYVARVQAADGEPLELGVASAYHAFCLGCKTDGIWDALKACCIMAGARTIEGALVPLKTPYGTELGGVSTLPRPSIVDAGGSTGQIDVPTMTLSSPVTGTNDTHPRFVFGVGATVGKRYRVTGKLRINVPGSLKYLLFGTGIMPDAATYRVTGEFSQFVTPAGDGSFRVYLDGTVPGASVTIESLSIREDSFTPTPVNLVSGDYSRSGTLGIKGDGATKYLNANRPGNADTQDDKHLAVYKTDTTSAYNPYFIGYYTSGASESSAIGEKGMYLQSAAVFADGVLASSGVGLHAASRDSAAEVTFKRPGVAVQAASKASVATPTSVNSFVFANANNAGSASAFSASRLSFYSLGASLDLAALDARVTALMTAIGAAL